MGMQHADHTIAASGSGLRTTVESDACGGAADPHPASVYATWTLYVGALPEHPASHHWDGTVSIPVTSFAPGVNTAHTSLHGTLDQIDDWLDQVRRRVARERRHVAEQSMTPLGGAA